MILISLAGGPVCRIVSAGCMVVSIGGRVGTSARGVGCSSFAKPLGSIISFGKRGLGLSTGVELDSMSESLLGVAAPLSEEIHSSSSPSSEGLAMVKPTLCLDGGPLLVDDPEARRNTGATT